MIRHLPVCRLPWNLITFLFLMNFCHRAKIYPKFGYRYHLEANWFCQVDFMKFMSCFTMILYFCLHPSNLCIYLCSAPSSSILFSETVIISPLIIFPYLNSILAHFSTLALSGIHLMTLEEWKAELVKQCQDVSWSPYK